MLSATYWKFGANPDMLASTGYGVAARSGVQLWRMPHRSDRNRLIIAALAAFGNPLLMLAGQLHSQSIMVYNSVTFNPLWLYDWDVRATVRKIVCVGILACAYFAGVSEPSPAQKTTDNVTEFRLNELERRSEKLEFLPDRATRIESNQVEMNKRLDSIDSKAWYFIAALLLATMDRLLGLLFRVRDRAKKED